jgi:predicted secreted protein
MGIRHLVSSVSSGLILAALASAAYNAPQFTLSNVGSQTGFTDNATVKVTVTSPLNPHSGTLWCITQDSTLQYCQSSSNWAARPSQFTLTGPDGLSTVYLEYKYKNTVSAPGEAQITLDQQAPTITLAAPAGLPGALPGGLRQALAMRAQSVTGYVSDAVSTDPVTLSLYACNQEEVCTNVNTISSPAAPFVWEWPVGGVLSDTTYIQLQAVNAAGKSSSTAAPNPATVFSVFNGVTTPVTCSAEICPTLAGPLSAAQYMPNDAPSQELDGQTFTGYADPSMRRDPVVGIGNPNGTNLWMLYSRPEVQTNTTYGTASTMVEVHLAESQNSGSTWKAWCAPAPCSQETPIWPSYHWQPKAGQPEQYSSHEVANFWPYSSDNVSWKWYAVHLMYFVQPPNGIPYGITTNGCLVTSVATSPYGLGEGWTGITQLPPSSCTASMPPGNQVISYAALTAAAGSHAPRGLSCAWGEPAIMVQSGVAYLAASCFNFNSSLYSYGYYIFANALDSSGGLSGPWSYYGGPLTIAFLKELIPKAQFVTEFDWAIRSDGSLVAVASPASISNHTETQYGCIAADFSLTTGFGTALVAVNDQDPLETLGPNACTYEPTSNTGMLIVRRLINGPNYTAWSLVPTGLMP